MPDLERLGEPDATYMEDLHRYVWNEVSFLLERFSDTKDDVRCELTVELNVQGFPRSRQHGFMLLIGPNSKRDWARDLAKEVGTIDWVAALGDIREASLHRLRQGAPVVDLGTAEVNAPAAFLLRPLILDGGTTTWFGSGGSGKSSLALAAAYSIATGIPLLGMEPSRTTNGLYLDWEDDADGHIERLNAMRPPDSGELRGQVYYQKQTGPIKDRVRELRRTVADPSTGVGFVVLDSVGMAGGDVDSANEVIAVYNACRALSVPVLAIHHLPKDAKNQSLPYGSVYASNASRYTVRVDAEQEDDITHVAMSPVKTNRTRRHAPVGYNIQFQNRGDRLERMWFHWTDGQQVERIREAQVAEPSPF